MGAGGRWGGGMVGAGSMYGLESDGWMSTDSAMSLNFNYCIIFSALATLHASRSLS